MSVGPGSCRGGLLPTLLLEEKITLKVGMFLLFPSSVLGSHQPYITPCYTVVVFSVSQGSEGLVSRVII